MLQKQFTSESAQLGLARGVVHVPHTKTGTPLELPITRQLASILDWRRSETGGNGWVFPSSSSRSGHVSVLTHLYAPILCAGGRKFWFHGFRNCLITIADRDLTLPRSLTKRLVNHARPTDVTEGYAADWTMGLRGRRHRVTSAPASARRSVTSVPMRACSVPACRPCSMPTNPEIRA